MDMNELRQKINDIDDVLSGAFKKRMRVALELRTSKRKTACRFWIPDASVRLSAA